MFQGLIIYIADYVTTNMAGDVPSSCQKYSVVSHLQMLMLSYERWSLTSHKVLT